MKTNLIGHSAPALSSRPTTSSRSGALNDSGPRDGVTLSSSDWQWGDPLSALPERADPSEVKTTPASWSWGDPLSAHPRSADTPTPAAAEKTNLLDPPSSPAGWTWGDPLPSW